MTEANTKTISTLPRLGDCEVCATSAARYACPKCEVKTCSLSCVQIHKRELNCDGIRDRTKYMPLNEMTEREFMSDYCFLEECTRYAENRKEDRCKRYTHQQRPMPLPLQRMRTAALQRGIRLQFLLPHFSRHKENTTYLNWKQRRLYWQIEWLFTHAASVATTGTATTRFVDTRCDEQLSLTELLHKYLDLEQQAAREQHKLLQHHQNAGIGQLNIWLRAEGVRRCGTRCYRLAAYKSLCDNLKGKTIVEYPTIYVSYEQQPPAGFDIIDSDEELEDNAVNTNAGHFATKRGQQQTELDTKEQEPTAAKQTKAAGTDPTELAELQDVFEWAAKYRADNNDDPSEESESSSENK